MGKKDKLVKATVMADILKTADENGWDLHHDPTVVERVRNAIVRNIATYGKRYCPCVIIRILPEEKREQYICPCKAAKTDIEEEGRCRCQLYFRKEQGVGKL